MVRPYVLDGEAEVEQATGGVSLPIGPCHLTDEVTEAAIQLGCRAVEDVLLQRDDVFSTWRKATTDRKWIKFASKNPTVAKSQNRSGAEQRTRVPEPALSAGCDCLHWTHLFQASTPRRHFSL